LTELNELRKENGQLTRQLAEYAADIPEIPANLAGFDETFEVHGRRSFKGSPYGWTATATWREIFGYIAPYLVKHPAESVVKGILEKALFEKSESAGHVTSMHDQLFQTISIQLRAYGLVNVSYSKTVAGGMGLFWSATPAGEKLTFELRTVRGEKSADP